MLQSLQRLGLQGFSHVVPGIGCCANRVVLFSICILEIVLVKEEPELFPFLSTTKTTGESSNNKWDYSRFNPAFFKTLEQQIDALDQLGIEADLILFHPYDKGRWGFDSLPSLAMMYCR